MRKFIFCLLVICLLFCSGCDSTSLNSRAEQKDIDYVNYASIVVADSETHILYIYHDGNRTGYICPYYSKNGKLCKYEDGKIIELGE